MLENVLTKTGYSLLSPVRVVLNWLAGSSWRAFFLIFILAFGIRAYSLRNIPIINLLPNPDRELGAIARSLAETGQFANPYISETGPTAHLPPIPPAIYALVYYWFGFTNTAGYIFMGFTIASYSVIYALLPRITDRLDAGRPAGLVGGLIGACILEPELSDHGEGLTAMLLGLMLVAFLDRWNNKHVSLITSLLVGLGIGVCFHVQLALLLPFLGYFAYEIGWCKGNRKVAISCMLAVGVVLACVPWALRNYNVFHEFFLIRSNLGLELRMGNSAGAAATFEEMDSQGHDYQHPRLLLAEALKVRELGEAEYMRRALEDALNWIKENPGRFLKLTFLRFVYFWIIPPNRSAVIEAFMILAILGARRMFPGLSLPQRIAILTPLIMYPLIYYLVLYTPRYRTPIDWMIFMFAGVEVWNWISIKTELANTACPVRRRSSMGDRSGIV